MSKEVKVDWTKAPEGATEYNYVNEMWYQEVEGIMRYWNNHRSMWEGGGERSEYTYCFIPRPVETKKVESKTVYGIEDLEVGMWLQGIHWKWHVDSLNGGLYISRRGDCWSKCYPDDFRSEYQPFHKGFSAWSYTENGVYTPVREKPKQLPECKIKHIKADDYKCGRDVALTILYKDVGDGYYEYKYAICNPKDMFSRKKGVEVALSKPDTWKVYVGNYNKVIEPIIYHIVLSAFVSKDFVNLVVGQGFFNP